MDDKEYKIFSAISSICFIGALLVMFIGFIDMLTETEVETQEKYSNYIDGQRQIFDECLELEYERDFCLEIIGPR